MGLIFGHEIPLGDIILAFVFALVAERCLRFGRRWSERVGDAIARRSEASLAKRLALLEADLRKFEANIAADGGKSMLLSTGLLFAVNSVALIVTLLLAFGLWASIKIDKLQFPTTQATPSNMLSSLRDFNIVAEEVIVLANLLGSIIAIYSLYWYAIRFIDYTYPAGHQFQQHDRINTLRAKSSGFNST